MISSYLAEINQFKEEQRYKEQVSIQQSIAAAQWSNAQAQHDMATAQRDMAKVQKDIAAFKKSKATGMID